MQGDRELEVKIRDYEARLRKEETRYFQAVQDRQNYDILKAIRNDIRDIKQELQVLYDTRDKRM